MGILKCGQNATFRILSTKTHLKMRKMRKIPHFDMPDSQLDESQNAENWDI